MWDIFTIGENPLITQTATVSIPSSLLLYVFIGVVVVSVISWLILTHHWSFYGKGVITMPAQLLFTAGLVLLIGLLAKLIL